MRKAMMFVLLLGTGCATTWNKPGATRENFADDQLKCESFVAMRCIHAEGWGVPVCRAGAYDGCMQDRGWTKQ